MSNIREVRILIEHRGKLSQLCKVAFSQTDASLYLLPYAAQGHYYYGSRSLSGEQVQDTFDVTKGFQESSVPKISIHETGRVHVLAGKVRAGPLQIPPLRNLRGQHIATIAPDAFVALKPFVGTPRKTGPELDHVIPTGEVVENGRLAIYVNGNVPVFDALDCRLTIKLLRPTLGGLPLYVGMKVIAQLPLGEGSPEGVTVIAGWDPTRLHDTPVEYLYVRGR